MSRPLLVVFLALAAQVQALTPSVWIAPPGTEKGRAFRDLFEHPDDWKDARSKVDVLFYTDLNLQRQFTDDELHAWFGKMKDWNLKLAMEVGALKEWGLTGEKTFNAERRNWEHLQSLGANVYAVCMDEPLCCAREHIHQTDDYAMRETANYIALVREHFPQMLIGDIETYPSLSIEDHKHWIAGLQKLLTERKVRGLDFYRLDVDWHRFTVKNQGSWQEVKTLEHYCRQQHLPFSLIYWPSGYPAMLKRGIADDSTWYVGVMQQGYDYAGIDGRPDHYVIESWVGAPQRTVPESADWTFTRTVRDFCQHFVKRTP
ncbi:MAG: hypothetical protein JWO94_2720 [Verrucomicrobiaceae bacterium]|nr:hypothetical protein [Verrucomicrobiaceae bacterium]